MNKRIKKKKLKHDILNMTPNDFLVFKFDDTEDPNMRKDIENLMDYIRECNKNAIAISKDIELEKYNVNELRVLLTNIVRSDNKMNIKILNDLAKIPTYGSDMAAGADLYAAIENEVKIYPHKTVKIGTGIAIQLPDYVAGLIFPRSGIASKQGLRPANTPGLIDPDYRGEVIVALHNDSEKVQVVKPGDRIAQLVCMNYYNMDFNPVDELNETKRGNGGFGSTGVN